MFGLARCSKYLSSFPRSDLVVWTFHRFSKKPSLSTHILTINIHTSHRLACLVRCCFRQPTTALDAKPRSCYGSLAAAHWRDERGDTRPWTRWLHPRPGREWLQGREVKTTCETPYPSLLLFFGHTDPSLTFKPWLCIYDTSSTACSPSHTSCFPIAECCEHDRSLGKLDALIINARELRSLRPRSSLDKSHRDFRLP